MVSFFKKKVKASEVGLALLQIPNADLIPLLKTLEADIDRQRVHDELVHLQLFVADYAICMSLGNNSPVTAAILNVFYSIHNAINNCVLIKNMIHCIHETINHSRCAYHYSRIAG